MTNVWKLDQIWRFQHKKCKNIKFLCTRVHIFTFLLPKILSSPPNFDAGGTAQDLLDIPANIRLY